uniref:Integrase, catalytic region, zinc finger, CCHC-type, peptidase aspartic, catalytic n=1 Tax=Tanacetum cinerariifolium TaxID=118510 RepID=A0A6L2MMS5_TANCI|nr:integrase, catalytic region, zinc finger, CCHC-type, peptidase aspartic, catalytic [Tanacetum cinerariifolium]
MLQSSSRQGDDDEDDGASRANDTKTSSPKHQLPSPSAPNAPLKTPSTKDTSSSSIDYIPKSPTSSTSPSTNGYLKSPTSPPLRVPPPPPIQERNATWYKDKAMLAEAQEAEQVLDEEQLTFLADPRVPDAVLMANISIYGSIIISEVPHSETFLNDMENQKQMINHVNICEKANMEQNNESITAELETYKERVKTFKQCLNIDLSSCEKMIDSQMDDMIKENLLLKEQVDSLDQNISNQIKEKECLLETFTVFKSEAKEKEDKYIENEIDLQMKIKKVDNIIFKVGQSAHTVHMLTKPQALYDNIHKQALGYQNPFYLKKAQRIKPTLCDGIVISNKHVIMHVTNDEEILILKDDFGKCFVPQQELSADEAVWYHMLNSSTKSSVALPIKIEAPKELPKERADILQGIVKQAIAKQPLDNVLDFACKHVQRIQELLVYVRDTWPNAIKPSAKKVAVTPKNNVKKVRFSEPLTTSSNIKQVVQIVLWYLDSGCLKHMTRTCSQLMNFVSKFLGTVRFENDHIPRIMGFLRSKDEAPKAIIKCIKNIQVRLNATVCNVRTDNGTEFVNKTLREFYENVGISHQTSVARTLQQNGAVERAVDLADSPVSTSIDQDASSTSTPSTQDQEHSPIISQGFEESPKTPHFHEDPLLEQRLNIDLSSHEKMIDSQMDDMIKEKLTLKEKVDSLEQNLFNQNKEKECLLQTFTVFKSEAKEKEDKYMENEIDLEKKIKELDNIILKWILEDVSRSKMAKKDKDPEAIKQKVSNKPIDDVKLNKIYEDFGKRFVPQQELLTNEAVWYHMFNPSTKSSVVLPVKIEAPKELPKVFKEQFDSIKKTRVRTKEQRKEIVDIATQKPSANTVVPGMFKLDLVPLAPKLLQNREAHIDYLMHTQEQADILQGIVKQAIAKQPLDNALDFSCKHVQRIQELLVYIRDTWPNAIKPSAKKGSNATDIPLSSSLVMTVRFENDHIERIMEYGDYQLGNITISRVYYIEGLGQNLFSVVPIAASLRVVDLADSPMSTLIDQDAPSTNPLLEYLHEDSTSHRSSSNVRLIHTLIESLGRWTKDHPIANVIDDPSCSVSIRKQLQTDAMWCYFDAFLTSVEPKNFKQAMTEPS